MTLRVTSNTPLSIPTEQIPSSLGFSPRLLLVYGTQSLLRDPTSPAFIGEPSSSNELPLALHPTVSGIQYRALAPLRPQEVHWVSRRLERLSFRCEVRDFVERRRLRVPSVEGDLTTDLDGSSKSTAGKSWGVEDLNRSSRPQHTKNKDFLRSH